MKRALSFLIDLSLNNSREWFQANKARYASAAAEFEQFVDEMIAEVAAFDPAIAGITARDCQFRIYRDVRFSKDKSPYKTYFSAYLAPGGRKSPEAGYYIHFDAIRSFVAGGKHMPDNDSLRKIRTAIMQRTKRFDGIIGEAGFRKAFDGLSDELKLRSVPKGFPKDHPAAEYLKLKSFVCIQEIEPERMGDRKRILTSFRTMKPFIDFLRSA